MRTNFSLTRDGESFRARLTWVQADAMVGALVLLADQYFSDAAVIVHLGMGRDEVGVLVDKLAGDHKTTRDYVLDLRELHAVHAALTAAATQFLNSSTYFSAEHFHVKLSFHRENFDALALSLVQAVSDVTAPE
ncbi:hypothetical protein [Streptomyces sp. RKAG293]|uniref:hypothetical protein n=1 Tax=Streptomyces sp. RKAG293 TaxID=2893403 RepID=UPI002033D526|nr:hypothetical protein [Streptomyces sp. RKAG293]MCM2423789.1 hypothetical protein [Streptomyces sp. RKAG293]